MHVTVNAIVYAHVSVLSSYPCHHLLYSTHRAVSLSYASLGACAWLKAWFIAFAVAVARLATWTRQLATNAFHHGEMLTAPMSTHNKQQRSHLASNK